MRLGGAHSLAPRPPPTEKSIGRNTGRDAGAGRCGQAEAAEPAGDAAENRAEHGRPQAAQHRQRRDHRGGNEARGRFLAHDVMSLSLCRSGLEPTHGVKREGYPAWFVAAVSAATVVLPSS